MSNPDTNRKMLAAVGDFAQSDEVREIFKRLNALQWQAEHDGSWDTGIGRQAEAVRGHLMMALEAAGVRV
ncbi:hypothetical protein [Isoptericola dokdonensis]|uniref:Uncharacterized protein n=1 Tax=Isoptericola dokdonensis DS-3 TaxID=1300344 RepID=A0A168FD76_9MICO|nr:hypothetical protein [Isoptericola dokdonensis]ANC31416.1 hypothetical protein I598_1868 [Isoptericola dokdonensis DS-3]